MLTKVIENCEQCAGLGKVSREREQVTCNLCGGQKTTERAPTLEERVSHLEKQAGGGKEQLNLSRWK